MCRRLRCEYLLAVPDDILDPVPQLELVPGAAALGLGEGGADVEEGGHKLDHHPALRMQAHQGECLGEQNILSHE